MPPETQPSKSTEDAKSTANWKDLFRLFQYLKPHKFWLSVSIFGAVVDAMIRFVTPYLLKNLTDTAVEGRSDQFTGYVYIFLAAMVVNSTFTYLSKISSARYHTYTLRDLRNGITGRIQHLPLSYTDSLHSGDLVSRLNNDADQMSNIIKNLPDYVFRPLEFIFGFTYMLFLSWKLLLATCILIPISAVLFDKVVRPIQAHSKQQMEYKSQANAASQDAIRGAYIVKAFNLKQILAKKYQTLAEGVEKEGLEIDRRSALLIALFLSLRYIPQLVAPLYGGYLAYQGEITVGSLLACNILIWSVFMPVETFLGWIRQIREAAPAGERLFQIMDQPRERIGEGKFEIIASQAPAVFEGVSFGYDRETVILDNLSFRLNPGETTALVGPSGSGKSTVFKLLCGFYEPQEGRIFLFGNDLFQSGLAEARTQVSLVSQDTYLFPATIAENIAYGRLGAEDVEIVAAAKAANAHDFIMERPEGYDTQVGEWGGKLSGGERQRIALARAILKDAPILLLDEPTSALDTRSEALVQEALDRLMVGRTALVVAHRLSTIQRADNILVMDQGAIKEQGTHQQLMQTESLYKQLYLKQMNPHENSLESQVEATHD